MRKLNLKKFLTIDWILNIILILVILFWALLPFMDIPAKITNAYHYLLRLI